MNNKYYLPVSSVNLTYYFSCACIKPSKYISVRTKDIQSEHPAYLLVSNEDRIKNSDCALELLLTKEEESQLIPAINNHSFFLLPTPLPLTRVVSIYFDTEEQRDKITTLINLSAAFIPLNITKLFRTEKEKDFEGVSFELPKFAPDFSKELKKYNSWLGAFALMKLARESYMNYSLNYFKILSCFNSSIEDDLFLSKNLTSTSLEEFIGKELYKLLIQFLAKDITEVDLESVAKLENQKINRDFITGVIEEKSLEKATYILSILYAYGVGEEARKSKVDGLILTNFQKNIKGEWAEVVALCYGLNRGYTIFNNKYSNESGEQFVKFQLDSKLDYFTIESIYQYSFNEVQKSKSFPYLDTVIPKRETKLKKETKNDYYILDKLVIAERIKVGDSKWWNRILSFFFQKNQEELFKPFLMAVFKKIKEDVEDESAIKIEEKDAEILKLKVENSDLLDKIKELQKRGLKTEKSSIKHSDLNTNISEIAYKPDDNVILNDSVEKMKSKIKAYEKLINSILSTSRLPSKAKMLIQDFSNQKIDEQD